MIDFVCQDIDTSLAEGRTFLKKAGGAPANVAAAIAKLGGEARFIGAVGQDPFGDFLEQTLKETGVDTSMLYRTSTPTTLAFVSLQADGERDFVFNRGADEQLSIDLIDWTQLEKGKILHLGAATGLLGGPLTLSYHQAWARALVNNQLCSFDPNFRTDLWKERTEEFVSQVKAMLSSAHLLKVSLEEMELLTNTQESIEAGAKKLHELGAGTIVITLGKDGTFLSTSEQLGIIPSIPVKAVDATGAGDAFIGALLQQLSQKPLTQEACSSFEEMSKAVAFANKVGAITCTQMGAIESIPTLEEVGEL